jgi:hypothetical protein
MRDDAAVIEIGRGVWWFIPPKARRRYLPHPPVLPRGRRGSRVQRARRRAHLKPPRTWPSRWQPVGYTNEIPEAFTASAQPTDDQLRALDRLLTRPKRP